LALYYWTKSWLLTARWIECSIPLAATFTKGMVCDPQHVLPEEGGGGLYAFLATNNGDVPEIRDEIKKVEAPVLVLQGQCEYHPFASAYEYVDLFPNSRYRFIEGAGHEIWWEQPEAFIHEITTFITSDHTP
jgi:proline iminopeptidase